MSEFSEKDFERLERYVSGNMTGSEKLDFEEELKSNSTLLREVEIYRESLRAIEAGAFREELGQIHAELYDEKVKSIHKRSSKGFWIGLAASIAVLVAVSLWINYNGNGSEGLIAEYGYTDPGLPVPMSAVESYQFYDAMVDYKSGEYNAALQKWTPLLRQEPQNDTLLYYVGTVHYHLGEFEQAEKHFSEVESQPASPFRDKAQYMNLLIRVGKNDREFVKNLEPYSGSRFTEKIAEIKEAFAQ